MAMVRKNEMTLTVCLQGKDAIVAASDSRGTFADPRGVTAQNDNIKKVYLVGNVAICSAGTTHANMIHISSSIMITEPGQFDIGYKGTDE